jgi:uncharacterized protein (TIGR02996 family)
MHELLERVYAAPDEDAPRRVLADALLDAGDPRGELISVQCQLAAVEEDERGPEILRLVERERELLDQHGDAWTKGWPFELKPIFRRGFPEVQQAWSAHVRRSLRTAMELAPTLRDVTFLDEIPIQWRFQWLQLPRVQLRHVTLPVTFAPQDVERLSAFRATQLTFRGGTLDRRACELLGGGGYRALAFEFEMGVDFEPLAALPLESLINHGNAVRGLGAAWPELQRLTLGRVEWRVRPREWWPKLRRLDLFDTGLERRELHKLLAAGHPCVRRLGLRGETFDEEAATLLERWPALEVLDLGTAQVPLTPVTQRLKRPASPLSASRA